MSVELTLYPLLEEASGTKPDTQDVAFANVGLTVDDGFDGENFYKALESLPSVEAPARLYCAAMMSGDEPAGEPARFDRYGKRLRTVTVRSIMKLEAHRGVWASARNRAAMAYLRTYAEFGPNGMDSRVVLFWH